MDRAGFRDYVFPLDHPRVARLKGKDAHAHAQMARGDPRAQELLIEPWSWLIAEPFTGITTDGTPIRGLFDLVPNDAPVAETVAAARRLLGLLDDEGRETVLLPLDARQWRMWNNTEIYFFVYGLRMDEISPALREESSPAPRPSWGSGALTSPKRMGAELMASLSPELQRQAVAYDLLKDPAMPSGRWHQADQRHLGGAFRDNRVIPYEGAPVSAFSASQRQRLMALAGEFLALPGWPARTGWPRSSATSTTPTSAGSARPTASIPSTTGSRAR